MTNELKRQHLSTPVQITTNTNEQQSFLPNTHSAAHSMETQTASDTEAPSNFDHDVDLNSSLIDDMKQFKLYAGRNTIERRPQPCQQQLPNEILALIINHLREPTERTLYQCALVTKQFYAIANPLLWQQLNLWNDSIRTTCFLAGTADASPQRLEILGQHIRELHLDGPYFTDEQLVRWTPHIPHLQHLTIYNDKHITDTSIQRLPVHCQHLTSLKLAYTHLTQVSFSAIGQYCHQLCGLDWTLWLGQSPEWLEMLTSCPLERLRINFEDMPMNEKVITAMKKFDRLTCLHLTPSAFGMTAFLHLLLEAPPTTTTVNNIHSTVPTRWWPQLTKLTLYPCNDIHDTTFLGLIKLLPRLQQLQLEMSVELTDASLDAIAAWLPELTHVFWTFNDNITVDGVRRLIRQCRHLVLVRFYECRRVLEKDFPELGLVGSKNMHQLKLDHGAMGKIRQVNVQANTNNNNNNNS